MVLDFFDLEDFKMSVPFTALGARVCYNDGDLQSLLEDPRVVDKDTRAKFLSKLGNYKHFSVFAHSFTYKKVGELNALKIAATYFKSHYNPKYPDVIGVSLRHYLEELLKTDEEAYYKAFEKLAEYDVPIKPLGERENVSLIGLLEDYDGYAVFYIDKISRALTHQLVRHTALNFSQRSQRYVKEEDNYLIIPPSIKEKAESIVKLTDEFCQKVYNMLVYEYKIKREDARFILPTGRRTTIVVSAPIPWIKDFIEKRSIPHAQWEIRNVANQMKELLEEQDV